MVIAKLVYPAIPPSLNPPGFHVFPNPAGEQVNVSTIGLEGSDFSFELYDALGRKLRDYPTIPGRTQHNLSLSGLRPGAYYLILGTSGTANTQIIIKR